MHATNNVYKLRWMYLLALRQKKSDNSQNQMLEHLSLVFGFYSTLVCVLTRCSHNNPVHAVPAQKYNCNKVQRPYVSCCITLYLMTVA